jgi:glycyl-tRNA synthetase (class II)
MSRIPFENIWLSYCYSRLSDNCRVCQKIINKDEHTGTENSWNRSHIISIAKGGPDILTNLIVLCETCNMEMRTDDLFEFMVKKQKITQEEADNFRIIHMERIRTYDPVCTAITNAGTRCTNRKVLLQFNTCTTHMPKIIDMQID